MRPLSRPFSTVLFIVGATLAAAAAPAPQNKPEALAQNFYDLTMRYNATGAIPGTSQQTRLDRMLTPTLMAKVDQARRADKTYTRKYGVTRRPLIEGDLFSSLYDGPTSMDFATCRADTDTTLRCPVHLANGDGSNAIRWTDTLVLVKLIPGWRIDDIEFGGAGPDSRTGTLTGLLKQVVDKGYAKMK